MEVVFPDLRPKREHKGFTRRRLADYIGVKPGQVYKIEKGIRLPSIPTLCRCVDTVGPLTVICDGKTYIFDRHSHAAD